VAPAEKCSGLGFNIDSSLCINFAGFLIILMSLQIMIYITF